MAGWEADVGRKGAAEGRRPGQGEGGKVTGDAGRVSVVRTNDGRISMGQRSEGGKQHEASPSTHSTPPPRRVEKYNAHGNRAAGVSPLQAPVQRHALRGLCVLTLRVAKVFVPPAHLPFVHGLLRRSGGLLHSGISLLALPRALAPLQLCLWLHLALELRRGRLFGFVGHRQMSACGELPSGRGRTACSV